MGPFMPIENGATGNHLLDSMARGEFDRLRKHLDPVPLHLRRVIQRQGEKFEGVYFPARGVASLVRLMLDGSSIEVGMIGREGFVGLESLLGERMSTHETIIQGAGHAFYAPVTVVKEEFDRSGRFHNLILEYADLFLEQVYQTAACNGRHRVEQRCARWLLMMRDQLGTNHFRQTQEFLAAMLGVQRTGVNAAALALQREGIITYRRGQIEILNPERLEEMCCECYGIFKTRLDAFLRLSGPANS
jgi:CRP-like cAMP-binding protein